VTIQDRAATLYVELKENHIPRETELFNEHFSCLCGTHSSPAVDNDWRATWRRLCETILGFKLLRGQTHCRLYLFNYTRSTTAILINISIIFLPARQQVRRKQFNTGLANTLPCPFLPSPPPSLLYPWVVVGSSFLLPFPTFLHLQSTLPLLTLTPPLSSPPLPLRFHTSLPSPSP